MKHTLIIMAGLSLAGYAVPCHAQSSDFDRAFAPQGAEARVSFTIPLGNSSNKTKTAPRLGFAVRNYEQSSRPSLDWMRNDAAPYREMRLGLTLEDSPQFMMNDKTLLSPQSEQASLGTAGRVGLGVAAVVVALVTVVSVAVLACSSDSECFEGPYD